MDNDDQQIGRILSRREVLALFGAAGAAALVGCGPAGTATTAPTSGTNPPTATGAPTPAVNAEAATAVVIGSDPTAQATAAAELATAVAGNTTTMPVCVVRPEVTEGPYYVDEGLVRSDVRTDSTTGTAKEGAPLVLTFNISQVSNGACTTLPGAAVEIWHCDAAGQYSDVTDPGFSTKGQNWLRGSQVTDANGKATFTTIYPGWYSGRAVHIHFKVHPDATKVFTSQLFFDDALSQQVFTQAPYASKGSTPDTLNSTDGIYQELLLLTTSKTSDGYAASFDIGIDPSTVGTGGSGGGPGGPPPSRSTAQPSS